MLERIPGDGRSLDFSPEGLNTREYEVRNQETVMQFLRD